MKKFLLLAMSTLLFSCGGGGDGDGASGDACGVLGLKVINGEQCDYSASPVVVIVIGDNAGNPIGLCSGTMISTNKVLTAAHCIVDAGGSRFIVGSGSQSARVSRAAYHPNYTPTSTVSPFDVAVMTLDRSLNLPTVPLLLSRNIESGDRCTVFGYGDDENGQSFAELGFAALKSTFVEVVEHSDGAIVSLFDETDSGACEGDSGGPLVGTKDSISGIVGVVQGGTAEDCKKGSLEVFTDLQTNTTLDFVIAEAPGAAVL